jgi:hypothetical protein
MQHRSTSSLRAALVNVIEERLGTRPRPVVSARLELSLLESRVVAYDHG